MKFRLLIPMVLLVLCAGVRLSAQSSPAPIYGESFRQGSTRILEEGFEVKLTPKDSSYHERIKETLCGGWSLGALPVCRSTSGALLKSTVSMWWFKSRHITSRHRIRPT